MSLNFTAAIVVLGAAALSPKNNSNTGRPVIVAQARTTQQQDADPNAEALPLDVVKRLEELRSGYDQYVRENIQKPYDEGCAILVASYLKALESALDEATRKGDLDTVVAVKTEMDRVTKKQPLPPNDDALPAAFTPLRVTYRTELTKLEQSRDAKFPYANQLYETALEAYQIQLTQSQQVNAALHVKTLRTTLAAEFKTMAAKARPVANSGTAVKDSITNSLGMKLVPVKNTKVLFCVHETRRQDYAAYAAKTSGVDDSWKTQNRLGIPCGDKSDHPVVGVSWEDAQNFCKWLSKKENRTYRLPTDEEWSIAVGLGGKEKGGKDITPEMLSGKETTEFPWESDFPPRPKDKAGNYGDTSWTEKFSSEPGLKDYTDGFVTTAPVMTFKANQFGLYDMGGNVWEWVEDRWSAATTDPVLRGASFYPYPRNSLLSSYRIHRPFNHRTNFAGFRVVLVAP